MKKTMRVGASVAALALLLTGCATNEGGGGASASSSEQYTGTLQGTGASSMNAAQEAWIAMFQTANPDVQINYSPEGSGAGRTAFTEGGADFAGSDRALKDEEMGAGKFAKCSAESNALNLPIYISPIAVIFNVDGVKDLNLDAATLSAIFRGEIKTWNDARIAALNPGVSLPSTPITAVHRSDNSGTTENFTATLSSLAPSVWTDKASGDWPRTLSGEAAKGTSGVVAAVKNGSGTIGYADESATAGLSHAKLGEGGAFVGPTAEEAAKIVDASKTVEGRSANDLALKLDRAAAGYPYILVSYAIACEDYQDDDTAKLVRGYLGYIASEQGQKDAAAAAKSAPLSSALSAKVTTSINSIK